MQILAIALLALSAPNAVLANFEDGPPPGIEAASAEIRVEDGAMRIAPSGEGTASVTLPVKADFSQYRALGLRLRGAQATIRWNARNGNGDTIFQRKAAAEPAVWTTMKEPFPLWRWASDRAGDWPEVRSLTLDGESKTGVLWLDDVVLMADERFPTRPEWLWHVAFGTGKATFVETKSFLIGTDCGELKEDDLNKLAGKLEPIVAWTKRVFGDAVRPIAPNEPIPLFLYSDREGQAAFLGRLEEAWRVRIGQSKAAGYTVGDIATAICDPAKGIHRPTFFHEAVHAVLARMVRVIAGVRNHSWLQEGTANYLQICLHPDSLDRKSYPGNFSRLIAADESGFFQPLEKLLAGTITGRQYAQLTSLVGYLSEKHAGSFATIARHVADGKPVRKALEKCGATFAGLQDAWFRWGRKTFVKEPPPDQPFPRPAEWQGWKE